VVSTSEMALDSTKPNRYVPPLLDLNEILCACLYSLAMAGLSKVKHAKRSRWTICLGGHTMGCQLGAMALNAFVKHRWQEWLKPQSMHQRLIRHYTTTLLVTYFGILDVFSFCCTYLGYPSIYSFSTHSHTHTHNWRKLIHQHFLYISWHAFLQQQNRNTAYSRPAPRNQAPAQRGPRNSLLVSNLHHNVTEKDLYVSPANQLSWEAAAILTKILISHN
jgi:hypothetical protein